MKHCMVSFRAEFLGLSLVYDIPLSLMTSVSFSSFIQTPDLCRFFTTPLYIERRILKLIVVYRVITTTVTGVVFHALYMYTYIHLLLLLFTELQHTLAQEILNFIFSRIR